MLTCQIGTMWIILDKTGAPLAMGLLQPGEGLGSRLTRWWYLARSLVHAEGER